MTVEVADVKGRMMGAAITIVVMGVTTQAFMEWKAVESQRRIAACEVAQQHMENLEIQTRAMAAGLSVDGYAEAEKTEAGKLIKALDTASNEAEVEAVIDAHAAELKSQEASTDAEVKSQGSQLFLEQQLKKQRISPDIKQEIKRAEKARSDACD
ncbi:hypothetical protein [Pseudomonas frederiksbergensis]|nr:hypothetical protein [Pseudomonas frederiksbergensis]